MGPFGDHEHVLGAIFNGVVVCNAVERADFAVFEHHILRQLNVVVLDILNVVHLGHLGHLTSRSHCVVLFALEFAGYDGETLRLLVLSRRWIYVFEVFGSEIDSTFFESLSRIASILRRRCI